MKESFFLNKEFPQKCGDTLIVLRKSDKKKDGHTFFICKFLKYPYIIESRDDGILRGAVVNPQIEQVEFVNKIWPQNCGDSLNILEKVKIEKEKRNIYNWRCIFQKYPYEVIASKDVIIKGKVNNPLVDEYEFIGKIYHQNCGDDLKVIKKTSIQNSAQAFVYECEFQKYPWRVFVEKQSILRGLVRNQKLPLYDKNNLIKYIQEKFKEKPTLQELAKNLNISISNIAKIVRKQGVYDYVSVFELASLGEKELKDYIQQFFDFKIENSWNELDGKEIDIYIPSLKIGFEFNGIYWHSNEFKDKYYHLDKLKLANSKGIKLYFIWQDEWEENKEQIKQWIKDILFEGKSKLFDKEVDKVGYINQNISEPILIDREGFLCYNCGEILK
jgi:transcriptional regulator with XRE-family HTH domain